MRTLSVGILRAHDIRVTHHADDTFTVHGVVIGKEFHWQRTEDQTFAGKLRVVRDGNELVAINDVELEEYLASVISSEMSSEAPIELLKAHAIISRSWVLAQGRIHRLFDVCADDHCQRYQGITRIVSPTARRAVEDTRGLVLTCDGKLCDTRYSKCCGGMTERFSSCWTDEDFPYLQAVRDHEAPGEPADLTTEEGARRWILSPPPSFCDARSVSVFSRIVCRYDQRTDNAYRWQVRYTREQLSRLVEQKAHLHLGRIRHLQPLSRGPSGRITRLRIVGEGGIRDIGKELEIRRVLSPTHLLSSAFIVEETPDGFTLHGAGWGHGVGLCQIGAAMMALAGYDHRQILAHYYPHTCLRPYE